MSSTSIAIESTGLVTSVGLSAATSCAAVRAKISNPTQTCFNGQDGERILAHQVVLDESWQGLRKLAKMASMAAADALQHLPRAEWSRMPMLLCVAEKERPGRLLNLDEQLLGMIQKELGITFLEHSAVISQGRVSVAVALAQGRALIEQKDSLLNWPTLDHYSINDRLLAGEQSNGFIPGEAAGALLLGGGHGHTEVLACHGIGFGVEHAPLESELPLCADGLSQAIKAALADADMSMRDLSYRITDLSGEHYYFKEASLALSRVLRDIKSEFDVWHPAESVGEVGSAIGVMLIAVAVKAYAKGYAKGACVLIHMSNDAGQRAALILRPRGWYGK